jgi:phage baseplate assembly protein W
MSEFDIQIDATQLFYRVFQIPEVAQPANIDSRAVQKIKIAPGKDYHFQTASSQFTDFTFDVTEEGKVTIDKKYSGFSKVTEVDGLPTLVISGWEVTIDALRLTGADPLHPNETGVLLVNSVVTSEDWIAFRKVRLVPAKGISMQPGGDLTATFSFNVELDGTFSYDDPAWDTSQGGFLSGTGTATLTILGYPLRVDATAVSKVLIVMVNNFPRSDTGKADMVLLPCRDYRLQFDGGPSKLVFNVELNGELSFNSTLSDSLKVTHEAGQPVLRVRPKNGLAKPPGRGLVTSSLNASSVLGRSLQVASGDLLFFDRADAEDGASAVKRDLALLVGRDNFLQSMQLMIETPFGSDIFNVNYGFDLLGILSTAQTVGFIKSLIRLNIVKSLSQDNRVREITEVVFDDESRFVEILPDQNADENRRARKVDRRWQAVIVLQTISEGDVALQLEGTELKT